MKRILPLLSLLFFTSILCAQIDTTKIAFVAYWSVGDSYDFKVSKSKQQWEEGELTEDREQSYIANFTVIDSTDTSYTVSWSYENDLGSTYEIPEELIEKFSKYEITEIRYKTSELGEFLEILNWEEVGETMNNMFEDIVEVLGGSDENKKKELMAAFRPFKQIYSSKQGIEELVIKELRYFHFPMGLEYDITQPILYEDEISNMFGGKPIKADAKIYFENVDFEESFCVVRQEMSLNKDDTRAMLSQAFSKMNLDDKEMEEAFKTADIQINDNNSYEYYYDPGIPHRIETTREFLLEIGLEKGKRIDKTIIELIYYD